MKIQLNIELDLPDAYKGYSEAELVELFGDYYVNYITVSHLTDAAKWAAVAKVGALSEADRALCNANNHNLWGGICRTATFGLQKVGSC